MQTMQKLPIDPTKEIWHNYLSRLATEPENNKWIPEDIAQRLQIWRKRFEVYSRLQNKSFKSFNNWRKRNKFKREGEKLQKALIALQELTPIALQKQTPHPHFGKMYELTQGIVNVQLLKLEIAQLQSLSKAQNLRRKLDGISLRDKKIKLDELRKHLAKEIESENNYSTTASQHKLDNTSAFFKAQKNKIHFNVHFRRMDKASDTINVFSAINNLLANIAKVSAPLFNALAVAGAVLHAVPFINSIVYAITILIHAAKMWLQNKSFTKKAFAGILVGVVIGGLITMGLGTVAAAAVAVGLMTIGTYVKHIHPWARYLIGIHKRKNELKELAETRDTLEKTTDIKSIQLSFRERQFLMVKAEEAYLRGDIKSLRVVRNLIMNYPFSELKSSSYIQAIINNQDLKKFLLEQMDQRKTDLEIEIKLLSALERRKRANVVAGGIAITGAILLFIPTPATWILGASLLLTSAVIGVSLSFNLHTKIKNLGDRIFSRQKTEPDTSEKEALIHKLDNKKSLKNSTAQFPFKPTIEPSKPTIELSKPPIEENKPIHPEPANKQAPSPPNQAPKNTEEDDKKKPHFKPE